MNKRSMLILWAGLAAATLSAQAESPYTTFDVYIYPEYSHPGIGIVIEGEVQPGQFPRFLEMEVPLTTNIALVQLGDDDANNQRIEIVERDGKAYLPVDVSAQKFQVQYFYNPFDKEGNHRAFEYFLATNEQLPEVHFILQQPIHAVNFTHDMPGAETLDGDFGLMFFRQHIEGMAPGEVRRITASYDNPSGTLSISTIQTILESQQGAAASAVGDPGDMTTMFLIMGALGAGFFLVMTWMKPAGRAVAPVEQTEAAAGKHANGSAKFCRKCGSTRRANKKFCPSCGSAY